jgi:subtilisin family serine protease
MRPALQLFALCAGALILASCAEPSIPIVAPPAAEPAAANPRSDGFIVIMKEGADLTSYRPGSRVANSPSFNISAPGQDAIVGATVESIRGVLVRGVASAEYLAGEDVEDVIPNYVADIGPSSGDVETGIPADPSGTNQSGAFFFANNTQWGYKKISVNRTWVPSRAGAGARVCIIDSGIDASHPEFVGKIGAGISFVATPFNIDGNFHGTHVAGTISTRGVNAASVAPDMNAFLIAKVFNSDGTGGSTTNILNAVAWCTDAGADVINMSLGFQGGIVKAGNAAFIAAFQAGMDYATNAGVLVVASAGNDAATLPHPTRIWLPAEANGVTSVAATGPNADLAPFGENPTWQAPGAAFDGIADYSNRGSVPGVDISAPGGNRRPNSQNPGVTPAWPIQSLILSVCSQQVCGNPLVYAYAAGTSMASPHVAGSAAVIRGRWPAMTRSPALRNKIEACLYRSIDNIGSTSTFGRGRLNVYKAATMPC